MKCILLYLQMVWSVQLRLENGRLVKNKSEKALETSKHNKEVCAATNLSRQTR